MAFDFGSLKSAFFDSEKVLKSVDAATRRVLSKMGAFVRQRARTFIRKAPKINTKTGERVKRGRRAKGLKVHDAIAPPGQPPYYHAG